MRWIQRGQQGIDILYDPLPQWSKRYDPITQQDSASFLPLVAMPRTLTQDMPREASPTGKSGVGVAVYSIARQPVEQLQRVTVLTDPDPIYKGEGKLITQGYVDPYATPTRLTELPQGRKWTA